MASNKWQIFTDGSLLDEKSGSGIIVYQNKVHMLTSSVNLREATVYQSEVKAIQLAAELLTNLKEGPTKCNIWLDNQGHVQPRSLRCDLRCVSVSGAIFGAFRMVG